MESLLAGQSALERVVAVHQLNDQTIRLYQRLDGKILQTDAEFFPFFFLADPDLISGYSQRCWRKELAGSLPFRLLVAFDRWSTMWDAVRYVLARYRAATGRAVDNASDVPSLFFRPDPVIQYLLQSGVTCYKNMPFASCVRMQVQLATVASGGPPSIPSRSGDRIVLIGLSDSTGWSTILGGAGLPEAQLLEQFVRVVQERDPDIVEGYQLIGHTLPYLLRRSELLGMELGLGRDGSEPRRAGGLTAEGLREGEAPGFDLMGRSVVDTAVLAAMQETLRRSFEVVDLPALASVFAPGETDVAAEPLTVSDARARTLSKARRRLEAELNVVRTTSEELLPPSIALCTLCPLPLSTLLRTGSALRAELIILREYLRQKHSLPEPAAPVSAPPLPGELLTRGLFADVLYAGMESLLPTVARLKSLTSRNDMLGAVPRLLSEITGRDHSPEDAPDLPMREARRLLRESCTALMSTGRSMFVDAAMIAAVAAEARSMLTEFCRTIELHNGIVIEYDTDGVYLALPDNVRGIQQAGAFIRKLSEQLPEGLRLERTVHYPRMFASRKRNHALLTAHGQLIIQGTSLLPHTLEPFFRRFLRQAILLLMKEDFAGLHSLYVSAVQAITQHRWTAADFCRSEIVHESLENYRAGLKAGTRKPSPPYQAADRGKLYFQPGDRIRYYVAGSGPAVRVSDHSKLAEEWDPNFPDDNTAYYLTRLEETAAKLGEFFSDEDARKIFSAEELFEFDPSRIALVRRTGEPEEDRGAKTRVAEEPPPFGIWLDEAAL